MLALGVVRETETWSVGSAVAGVILLAALLACVVWLALRLRAR